MVLDRDSRRFSNGYQSLIKSQIVARISSNHQPYSFVGRLPQIVYYFPEYFHRTAVNCGVQRDSCQLDGVCGMGTTLTVLTNRLTAFLY